ncbi:hypothetical protein EMMF5_001707 [Cystobasidiomycetes sp. EMM_F5]
MGGFLGYHVAKERYATENHHAGQDSWTSWGESRRRAREAYLEACTQHKQAAATATHLAMETNAPADPYTPAKAGTTLDPAEYGLFQQWKASQQPITSSAAPAYHGWGWLDRDQSSRTQSRQQQATDAVAPPNPSPLLSDDIKAQAAFSADKALDSLLIQIHGLKEVNSLASRLLNINETDFWTLTQQRLAEYRPLSSPSATTPASPLMQERKLV